MDRDQSYMERCLELASLARASGHTAVGALVVTGGAVIGEGIEGAGDIPGLLAHAEVIAILEATRARGSSDLSGCTLFTTVEPCYMCSYLIRRTRITRIVFGTLTAAGGATSSFPFLAAPMEPWGAPPEIVSGLLEEACTALLK
jgi:tRNA(adenine34) deaminase